MPLLPAEIELVARCAQLNPDPGTVADIRALATRHLDWARVMSEAAAHSTMPLLYRNLVTVCPDALPEAALAQLREDCEDNAAAMRMLTSRLVAVVAELSGAGIPAIPIKGPVLAASAYGDLTLRQWGDLDLVVPPGSYREASKALVEAGFRKVKQHGWQATFFDTSGPVVVDLHRAITEPRFPARLRFDEMWSRRTNVVAEGHSLPNLSPEDALLVLCVQLVKDGWDRRVQLSRVADVAQVQWAWPALDWPAVVERARQIGARRILHLGLLIAHDVLGSPPPPAGAIAPSDQGMVGELAARMRHDLLLRPDLPPPRRRRQHRFHFRVRERPSDKLFPYVYLPHYWRAHVPRLTTPTQRDRAMVSLPQRLSFLYYVIRPLRVVLDRIRPPAPRERTEVRRAPDLSFEVVGGRVVFVDGAGSHLVTLNSLGAHVWQALDDYGEAAALADHLLPNFGDVSRSQLEDDIAAFLDELRHLGLVVERAGGQAQQETDNARTW